MIYIDHDKQVRRAHSYNPGKPWMRHGNDKVDATDREVARLDKVAHAPSTGLRPIVVRKLDGTVVRIYTTPKA